MQPATVLARRKLGTCWVIGLFVASTSLSLTAYDAYAAGGYNNANDNTGYKASH